jgi:signal transduction histidine kinase
VNATLESLRRSAPLISTAVGASDPALYQQVADLFQAQLNTRVVILERLGRDTLIVRADSSRLGTEDVENDPLALEALRSGRLAEGRVERGDKGYAEIARIVDDGQPRLVLLLSAPLADRLSAVAVVKRDVLIFGGIALAVAWLVGTLGALKLTRRIRRLEVAAERIADGDFEATISDRSEDELGQLARTFDRMRERLSTLDRARREFVANASHELRTPLFALGGFLELLSDEDLDARTRRDFLQTARGQVDRLTRLATDLLDLSRLDAGQLDVEAAPVDLNLAAEAVVDEFRGLAESSEHDLRLRAENDAVGLGDEERVLQIARSLVANALRHTPPGTLVEVSALSERGSAVLRVRDTGPGIPPDDQGRVFERFYRGDGGAASGSGLGLAIARELAALMGGSLTLRSQPGETIFDLRLPGATTASAFSRENALTRS